MKIIIIALAVWRLSNMITEESGPFGVFRFLRERIAKISHYDTGEVLEIPSTYIAELFSCIKCMSIWVSFLFVILWLINSSVCYWIAMPFSVSVIAIIIDIVIRKGYNNE